MKKTMKLCGRILLWLLCLALPVAAAIYAMPINFNHLLGYGQASAQGRVASTLFVLSWIPLAALCGWEKKRGYVWFASLYFGVSLLLFLVAAVLSWLTTGLALYFFVLPSLPSMNKGQRARRRMERTRTAFSHLAGVSPPSCCGLVRVPSLSPPGP